MRVVARTLAFAVAAAALAAPALPAQAAPHHGPRAKVTYIKYDSPGPDYRSNESLNGEFAVVANTGRRTLNLSGWTLSDDSRHRYVFPDGSYLRPGHRFTVKTGVGRDFRSVKYQDRRAYVWNNDRDQAVLRDARGRLVHVCSYDDRYSDDVYCR